MTRTISRALVALALVAATAAPARTQARGADYQIIVHATNPTAQLSRDELSRIYLKKLSLWKDGGPVVVVDQAERSSVRAEFSTRVLGKDVPTMKNYWQQVLFSGRGVPPIEQPSDSKVIDFVASNPNAIGYVSAGANLPAAVKAVVIAR